MALFRREAMAGHGQALEGAVSIAVPLSWQLVGGLLFLTVAGAGLFLTIATTDRTLQLETTVDSAHVARAVLPQEDAALVASRACGTVTFRGRQDGVPACILAHAPAADHALADGSLVFGHPIALRLARPVPPGARGTFRLTIGRQSLWASLTR